MFSDEGKHVTKEGRQDVVKFGCAQVNREPRAITIGQWIPGEAEISLKDSSHLPISGVNATHHVVQPIHVMQVRLRMFEPPAISFMYRNNTICSH